MTQHLIHSILLALHNLALVVCAGAPCYLLLIILKRDRQGGENSVELDKLLARTVNASLPYFFFFALLLIATGVGMPLNRALNSGALRPMNPVAGTAAMLKLVSAVAFFSVMAVTFMRFNRPLLRLLSEPKGDPERIRQLSARRRKLLSGATFLAALILILSGFMRFQMC